jgi:hypothetical protein
MRLAIDWAAEALGDPSTAQVAICVSDTSEFTHEVASVSRGSPYRLVQTYTVLFYIYVIVSQLEGLWICVDPRICIVSAREVHPGLV